MVGLMVGLMVGQVNAGLLGLSDGTDFDEGIEYIAVSNPVKTITKDKIEVRELFWYYCPHCESLEDDVEHWLSSKNKDSEFVRQPAVFSKNWKDGSDYYYIMEDLGIVDTHHSKLFTAIHVERKRIVDTKSFLEWLGDNGIDSSRTNKYKRNFGIWMKTNKATKQTRKYGITGVPSIIVGGKYRVDVKSAGSERMIFKVVDFLVDKIKKEQKSEK